MSDIHILSGSQEAMTAIVVAHMTTSTIGTTGLNKIPTPITYALALIQSGYSSGKSVLPIGDGLNGTITPDEAEQIELGAIYEFKFPLNLAENWESLNNAQRAQWARDERNRLINASLEDGGIVAKIIAQLSYFGSAFT